MTESTYYAEYRVATVDRLTGDEVVEWVSTNTLPTVDRKLWRASVNYVEPSYSTCQKTVYVYTVHVELTAEGVLQLPYDDRVRLAEMWGWELPPQTRTNWSKDGF